MADLTHMPSEQIVGSPVTIRVPDKQHFYVSEAAEILAVYLCAKQKTISNRIYTRIETGDITAVRVLGRTMLERGELLRLLRGDKI